MGFQLFAKPRAKASARNAVPGRAEKSQLAPGYILNIKSGKWAGPHEVELLSKDPVVHREVTTAEQELQELQGQWELQSVRSKKRKHGLEASEQSSVSVFVRGKRVEEKSGDGADGRLFFNLVLATKAVGPQAATDKAEPRHELPPLDGPRDLPESTCKGTGKGKDGKGNAKGTAKGKKGQKGSKKAKRGHSVGHWMLLHHTPKLLVKPCNSSNFLWWHPEEHVEWSRGGAIAETCTIRYLSDSHKEVLERHADDSPGTWRTKKGVPVQLTSKSFKS